MLKEQQVIYNASSIKNPVMFSLEDKGIYILSDNKKILLCELNSPFYLEFREKYLERLSDEIINDNMEALLELAK